jgi:hypothetical protein
MNRAVRARRRVGIQHHKRDPERQTGRLIANPKPPDTKSPSNHSLLDAASILIRPLWTSRVCSPSDRSDRSATIEQYGNARGVLEVPRRVEHLTRLDLIYGATQAERAAKLITTWAPSSAYILNKFSPVPPSHHLVGGTGFPG